MELKLMLSVVAALIATTDCSCYLPTLYATTSGSWLSVYSTAYDYCTFYIMPSYSYSSSQYYLEISWPSSFFDVRGDMPFCKEDYVEVFLTSSYRSIGKFCSNNAGRPFTMYSRDGYAKIVHSTNGHITGKGFEFYFRLRSKSSSTLGGSASSTYCYNTNNYATSGVIYSTGWPSNYQQSYSSCDYKMSRSSGYQGVYVVFMDINFYNSTWYTRDCLQFFASNYSTSYYEKVLSSSLCTTNATNAYNTYSRYLKITFDRSYKRSFAYRGFVAGYVMFKNPSGTTKTSSNTTSIVLRVVIPIVIIAIIVIAVVVYTKKRQRSSGVVRHDQPQTASMVSTQQKTAQQTSQTASSMPSEKYAFNKTQYVYPTATVQGVGYPQGPYPVSYGTGPTYPTGQYTTSAYGAAQMSFMVPPAYSSTPVGAVQPLLPSGVQGQQPTGTVNPSYDGNTLPPIESSPNVPPPTYQEATCS